MDPFFLPLLCSGWKLDPLMCLWDIWLKPYSWKPFSELEWSLVIPHRYGMTPLMDPFQMRIIKSVFNDSTLTVWDMYCAGKERKSFSKVRSLNMQTCCQGRRWKSVMAFKVNFIYSEHTIHWRWIGLFLNKCLKKNLLTLTWTVLTSRPSKEGFARIDEDDDSYLVLCWNLILWWLFIYWLK